MCSVFLILYVSDINTINTVNHLIVTDFLGNSPDVEIGSDLGT